MLKKIIIAFVFIVMLLGGYATYYFYIGTRKASPMDVAQFEQNNWQISITYCQPSKKGRLIFGTEDSGALEKYGKVWRTGANAATLFETNQDMLINGQTLAAGKYQLFTIPNPDEWTIIINSATGQWGAYKYDPSLDVIKTNVPSNNSAEESELFTIRFEQTDSSQAFVLHWDQTLVKVPFSKN